ncbi:hypothetical protein B0T24DRAFT_700128 [Lasiosphaeria ovina]|uniref:Uncharacterized protein n=1 Tax=Lasiosphaeria ovina TaxID=92902 RepID=A0AAE0NA78_9PEZI|nr:hypothetical protein B0T24DRAFT_700128 [Lasiosphaeria ovina]
MARSPNILILSACSFLKRIAFFSETFFAQYASEKYRLQYQQTVWLNGVQATGGAQTMIDDGLYEKIGVPHPDAVFAQHLMQVPSGSVSIKTEPVLVAADTIRVRMFSSEGYAANPQMSVDITVVASKVIMALQELVREVSHGGGCASIYTEEMHAGEPGAEWIATSVRAPLTTNNPKQSEQLPGVFTKFFSYDNVSDHVPNHPCEDFSRLATSVGAPFVFWFLGRADPELLDRARKDGIRFADVVPIEHSPFNAPLIQPTLETGIYALSLAALSVLRGSTPSTLAMINIPHI